MTKIACFVFWSVLLTSTVKTSLARGEKPDVLFVAIDDLNDWVGYLGGYPGKVHTPHLDRLAKRGTVFTNAHTASPVCCPSRAAVMLGRFPSSTGIYNNGQWWKPHLPKAVSMPRHFRANGYRAVGAGKLFHHTAGNNPPGEWDAYRRMLFLDNTWIRWNSPLNYPYSPKAPAPPNFPFSGIRLYSLECDWGVVEKPDTEYDDGITVTYAIETLRKPREKPLFLACGIFHPHQPWYVPQRYLDLYPEDQVHVPEDIPGDLDDIPKLGRKLALRKFGDLEKLRKAKKWRGAIRHYLASISFADAQVGRLLDALDRLPRAKNTIIVLWSDHGWHLGEKRHWHKRTLWEEGTRVPLIVVAPGVGRPGQRCDEAVSLVDLFPTLVDLCELAKHESLDGESLVPLLRDPRASRKRPAVTEHEERHVSVRGERYRYIRYTDGSEELYDHSNDSMERTNLASRAEHAETKKRLAEWIPTAWAKGAPRKNAYVFDPKRYTFRHKKTGVVVEGGTCELTPAPK